LDGTGGVFMSPLDGLLAVRQTQKVHHEIAMVLADLRKQSAENPKNAEDKVPADSKAVTTKFYALSTVIDLSAVEKAVLMMVEPDSWAGNNQDAEGKIVQIDRTLVIQNKNEVHAKLKEFLDDLEQSTSSQQPAFGGISGGGVPRSGGGGFFRIPPAGSAEKLN
jgi:hypothetical protein